MSLLADLLLLPFTLALDAVTMALWVIFSLCEATVSLVWDLVWFSMSTIESILQFALATVGHALFEWLPMLTRLLYRVVLYTAPIAWRCVESISQILASAWMFVYELPWRATFVKIISTSWDYTSSAASLFHRQGSYTVREVSKIDYSAIWKHLSETYVVILTAIFVGVVTVVVIWKSQQKNGSIRGSSEAENRERELQLRRRSVVRRRHSRSTSLSAPQENDVNGTSTTNLAAIAANTTCESSDIDDTVLESTDSVKSHTSELAAYDTELLRKQLHQANEELSQERDKFLCIVCQDLKREVILRRCNHYCLCHECSRALRECPICKGRIRNTEKIYHA